MDTKLSRAEKLTTAILSMAMFFSSSYPLVHLVDMGLNLTDSGFYLTIRYTALTFVSTFVAFPPMIFTYSPVIMLVNFLIRIVFWLFIFWLIAILTKKIFHTQNILTTNIFSIIFLIMFIASLGFIILTTEKTYDHEKVQAQISEVRILSVTPNPAKFGQMVTVELNELPKVVAYVNIFGEDKTGRYVNRAGVFGGIPTSNSISFNLKERNCLKARDDSHCFEFYTLSPGDYSLRVNVQGNVQSQDFIIE